MASAILSIWLSSSVVWNIDVSSFPPTLLKDTVLSNGVRYSDLLVTDGSFFKMKTTASASDFLEKRSSLFCDQRTCHGQAKPDQADVTDCFGVTCDISHDHEDHGDAQDRMSELQTL